MVRGSYDSRGWRYSDAGACGVGAADADGGGDGDGGGVAVMRMKREGRCHLQKGEGWHYSIDFGGASQGR